jgi:hypothetical protein
VSIAGITEHPDSAWMEQMGRHVTWEGMGFLQDRRYLLHDRDTNVRRQLFLRIDDNYFSGSTTITF